MKLVKEFALTIVDIVEEKQTFQVNRIVYCVAMMIFFFQLDGYVFFSSPEKSIIEEKVKSLSLIFSDSTIFYQLALSGVNDLTIFFFYAVVICVYIITAYIVIQTIMRVLFPSKYAIFKFFFRKVNLYLNIAFIFFQWVVVIPILEITSGFTFCNLYSYTQIYTDDCSKYPTNWVILGAICLCCTFPTGFAVTYLYRNYEFNETELMKRKYTPLFMFQFTMIYVLVVLIYGIQNLNVGVAITQTLNVTFIYEIVFQQPFSDKFIMKFYSFAVMFYFTTISISTLWVYTPSLSDGYMFYTIFLLGAVMCGVAVAIYNHKYERVMNLNHQNFHKLYKYTTVYLEELFKLQQEQTKDLTSKCILLKILLLHSDYCRNDLCACKRCNFKTETGMIIVDSIHQMIEDFFYFSLQQDVVRNDFREYESISLKYISFLAKYHNNPAKALYQLKILSQQKQNYGFYFKTISKILNDRIILSLRNTQIFNQKQQLKSQDETYFPLEVDTVMIIDDLLEGLLIKIKDYSKLRQKYWERIITGQLTTGQLFDRTLEIAEVGKKIEQEINSAFSKYKTIWKKSLKMIKVLSLFKCVVRSEMQIAQKLELTFQELIQTDSFKNQAYINNLNFLKENIASISISISRNKGKILSKVTPKVLRLFGFAKEDTSHLVHIEQLMPSYIADIHSNILDTYLQRGYSKLIDNSHFSFGKDKAGFVMPINIFINSTQLFQNDFSLNALIVSRYAKKEFLIMRPNGKIAGMTSFLFKSITKSQQKKSLPNKQKELIMNIQEAQNKLKVLFFIPDLAKPLLEALLKKQNSLGKENNSTEDDGEEGEGIEGGQKRIVQMDIQFKLPSKVIQLQGKFKKFTHSIRENQLIKNNMNERPQKLKTLEMNASFKIQKNDLQEISSFQSSEETKKILSNNNISHINGNNQTQSKHETEEISQVQLLSYFIQFYEANLREWEGESLQSIHSAFISVRQDKFQIQKQKSLQEIVNYVIEVENFKESIFQQTQLAENPKVSIIDMQGSLNSPGFIKSRRFSGFRKYGSNSFQEGNTSQTFFPLEIEALKKIDEAAAEISLSESHQIYSSKKTEDQSPQKKYMESSKFSFQLNVEPSEKNIHSHSNTLIASPQNSETNVLVTLNLKQAQVYSNNNNNDINTLQSPKNTTNNSIINPNFSSDIKIPQSPLLSKAPSLKINQKKENIFLQYQVTSRSNGVTITENDSQYKSLEENTKRKLQDKLSMTDETEQYKQEENRSFKMKSKKSIKNNKKLPLLFDGNNIQNNRQGSSINSVNTSSSSEDDIIPTIISTKVPRPLLRLRFVLYIIILVFVILAMICAELLLPQIPLISDSLDQFPPVNSSINTVIQSAIYSMLNYKCTYNIAPSSLSSTILPYLQLTSIDLLTDYHITQEQLLDSEYDLPTIWNTQTFSIFIFSAQIESSLSVDFYTYQNFDYENVNKNTNAIQNNLINLDSFYFLITNLHQNIEISNQLLLELNDFMQGKVNLFDTYTTNILIVASVLQVLVIVLISSTIIRINDYYRKILLIITRMSLNEASIEIAKLTQIDQSIQVQDSDSWLGVNFRQIMVSDNEIAAQIIMKNNKKEQHLFSMIKDVGLGFWKKLGLVLSVCLLSLLFFIVLAVKSDSFVSQLNPAIDLYTELITASTQYSSLLCHAEILATYRSLTKLGIQFPTFDIALMVQQYEAEVAYLTQFNVQFPQFIQDSDKKTLLQIIFQQNLCVLLPNNYQCTSTYSDSFSMGMSDLISRTLQLLGTYKDLMHNTVSDSDYSDILNAFLLENDYLLLIGTNHGLPQQVFSQANSYAYDAIHTPLQSFILFQYLYLLLGGITFSIALYIVSHILQIHYKEVIQLMNYSLLLIPHQKINDENTKHLLKQILLY